MGVISVAVEHAISLGASAEQILSLVQAMEVAMFGQGSLVRLPDAKILAKKITKENHEVSGQDSSNIDSSLVTESTSALVQESICEIRQKPRKRKWLKDTPEFNRFWTIYPRRVGKGEARKAWAKATEITTMEEIYAGAERFATQCRGKEEQFIAFPSTWLNQERWLDEGITQKITQFTPKRTWAEIKAERESNALVRGDDESAQGNAGRKEPKMARVSDFLPTLPPMDQTQENQAAMLAEAIPDEVFIRRDEREPPPVLLSN